MRLTLAHPEQSPVPHLKGVRFPGDQANQPSICWRRQRTVVIGRVPTGGARSSIETPVGHMGLERRLERRYQLLKLIHGETGQIEPLCGAALEIGEPYSAQGGGLLSLEA
jgi:hypothetical protein